jgi:hypothetical protein
MFDKIIVVKLEDISWVLAESNPRIKIPNLNLVLGKFGPVIGRISNLQCNNGGNCKNFPIHE